MTEERPLKMAKLATHEETATAGMMSITSQDGVTFRVNKSTLEPVGLISDFGGGGDMDDDEEAFPLPMVPSASLEKIIGFLQLLEDEPLPKIPKPLPANSKIGDHVPQCYADFVAGMSFKEVENLINMADYLVLNELIQLLAATTACMLGCKTIEEIEAITGVKSPHTPEEMAKLKEENKWALERPELQRAENA